MVITILLLLRSNARGGRMGLSRRRCLNLSKTLLLLWLLLLMLLLQSCI
jgi:hypothetical protein